MEADWVMGETFELSYHPDHLPWILLECEPNNRLTCLSQQLIVAEDKQNIHNALP